MSDDQRETNRKALRAIYGAIDDETLDRVGGQFDVLFTNLGFTVEEVTSHDEMLRPTARS